MRKNIIFFIFLTLIIFVLYYPLYGGYFQQDEFMAFGSTYSFGNNWLWSYVLDSFKPTPGHYVPFFVAYYGLLFKFFEINYPNWLTISIFWHIVNSYTVFIVAKKILNKDYLARITSVVFAVLAAGHQGTSWVVADGNTHGATFFVLVSLIFLSDYLNGKKKSIYFSLLFLVVSMLFKEISVGMFLFVPIVLFVSNKTKDKHKLDFNLILFLLFGLMYFAFRYLTVLGMNINANAPVVTNSQSLSEILGNLLTFPIKTISQIVLPSYPVLTFSKYLAQIMPNRIAGIPGTTANELFYLKYIFGSIGWVVFIILFTLIAKVARKIKSKTKWIVLFSFLFVVLNSFVYVLSPGRSSFVPVIDSRNLYMPGIGVSFLITSLLYVFLKNKQKIFVVSGLIIIMNIFVLRAEIVKVSSSGRTRVGILRQINKEFPILKSRQIFYFESDTSYFGLPPETKILPFQSGLGQTLLVWYQGKSKFPGVFFKDNFLWEIDSQGYKEIDGVGFGYFRDYGLLKQTLEAYNLPVESVIAYSWDSRTMSLFNMSDKIRSELSK